MKRPSRLVGISSALLVAGCSPARAPEPAQDGDTALLREAAAGDCLMAVWGQLPQGGTAPDRAYDRAHDRARGGSISCATGTSASAYRAVLAPLAAAARAGDRDAILARMRPPLTFIAADGRRATLADRAAIARRADALLNPDALALIAGLRIEDMAVAEGGGSFALGALWLAPARPAALPDIVTVNLQALAEARAAAGTAAVPPRSTNDT